MARAPKAAADPSKPKKTVNRKVVQESADPFYAAGNTYDVIQRESLNFFEPKDNSNKFYMAELHASTSGQGFRFYLNYGRVGTPGQSGAKPFPSLEAAQTEFRKKVAEKVRKGYVRVEMATTSVGSKVGQTQVNAAGLKGVVDPTKLIGKPSTLPPQIASLVEHLYEEANKAVSMSISGSTSGDISTPIGNLGVGGIRQGIQILSLASEAVRRGDLRLVEEASIQFYKNVPRKMPSNLRTDRSWVLDTADRIERELDILKLYEDTLRMLPVMGVSDLDAKYRALYCDVKHITDASVIAKIQEGMRRSKAPNHRFNLRVENVYAIRLHNEPGFDPSPGNIQTLYHGSRSAHLIGIMSSHLKLPHKLGSGVTKAGAMFGPGLYFANNSTKSANYSFAAFGGNGNKRDTAFMFLAEVALGRMYEVDSSYYCDEAPRGYQSVKGCKGRHLQNDEFIVYRENQARLRYLVEVSKVY